MPEDNTPDPDPNTFSIDDWIKGATRREDVIMLSSKGREYGQFKALEVELQAAQRVSEDEADRRLVGGSDVRRIAEQMEALRKVIAAGRRPFRLRGLAEIAPPGDTQPDLKTVREQTKDLDEDESNAVLLSACCIDPQLTPQKWTELRGVIGEGQWTQAIRTYNQLTFGEAVDAPFSVAASVALATAAS